MTTPLIGDRQHRILTFIAAHTRDHGYPPSVREIGDHVGLVSTSTVHHHLRALEAKGLLRRVQGRSRAVVVVAPNATRSAAA